MTLIVSCNFLKELPFIVCIDLHCFRKLSFVAIHQIIVFCLNSVIESCVKASYVFLLLTEIYRPNLHAFRTSFCRG